MCWGFGFAKVAAQVSAFAEDFCQRLRGHFSIFACLSQKVRHLRPSMLRVHWFLVPLFPRTRDTAEKGSVKLPFNRVRPTRARLDATTANALKKKVAHKKS